MNERKIGTYKLKKSLKIAFTPEYQPFIHACITHEKNVSQISTLICCSTGQEILTLRERKRKWMKKLTKDNNFKGLVAVWREGVGWSGCKGGFIRIQFFECIKIGLTLPRNLEVISQFFPKTFSTSQIWKKKNTIFCIHWTTTYHLRDESVFGDAAVSNDIKLQTTKPQQFGTENN